MEKRLKKLMPTPKKTNQLIHALLSLINTRKEIGKYAQNTPYDTGGFVVFKGRGEDNKTIVRPPFGHVIPVTKDELYYENLANARLISQAPKMHQMCEMFFDTLSNKHKDNITLGILSEILNSINPKD